MKVILERLESENPSEVVTELAAAMRCSTFTCDHLAARLCAYFFVDGDGGWAHEDHCELEDRLRHVAEAFQDEIDARRPTSPPPLE